MEFRTRLLRNDAYRALALATGLSYDQLERTIYNRLTALGIADRYTEIPNGVDLVTLYKNTAKVHPHKTAPKKIAKALFKLNDYTEARQLLECIYFTSGPRVITYNYS